MKVCRVAPSLGFESRADPLPVSKGFDYSRLREVQIVDTV
jgi:hypothetical protein